jgi:hypothetical protein
LKQNRLKNVETKFFKKSKLLKKLKITMKGENEEETLKSNFIIFYFVFSFLEKQKNLFKESKYVILQCLIIHL